jgi:hypothetical protein
MYLKNAVGFRYIIVNTLHKGDTKGDENDDDDNNNNNNNNNNSNNVDHLSGNIFRRYAVVYGCI